jgi:cytoskeletal protein RodZ
MLSRSLYYHPDGYIALISAIIISAVLVILAVSISQTGFLARFNVADSEYKKQSSALAEACIDTALLRIAQDPTVSATSSPVNIGSNSCNIVSVQPGPPYTSTPLTIQTQGVFQDAVTNIQVKVNADTLSLLSWQECSTDTTCP